MMKFEMHWSFMYYIDKKEEIWLSPMTKAPTPTKGVGEGGAGGGGLVPPPTFKSGGGGTSGFVPPHFWAEQMFLFHYLLIFCG